MPVDLKTHPQRPTKTVKSILISFAIAGLIATNSAVSAETPVQTSSNLIVADKDKANDYGDLNKDDGSHALRAPRVIADGGKARDYGDLNPDDGSHAVSAPQLIADGGKAKDYGDTNKDDGSHAVSAPQLIADGGKAKDYGDTNKDDGSHQSVKTAPLA